MVQKYQTNIIGKKILVCLGRPVKRKGFSWFIKNVMPEIHRDFVLILIGPVQNRNNPTVRILKLLPGFIRSRIELLMGMPSDEPALRKLLSPANKVERVIRLGKLPQNDIDAVLGVADAFIMPNIEIKGDMEGFGLVCLEACMRGAKVFASASGGITDAVINNKNGIILPPGHITSWIYALNNLFKASDSYLRSEEIISFTKSSFGWKKMAEQYLFHFEAISQPKDTESN